MRHASRHLPNGTYSVGGVKDLKLVGNVEDDPPRAVAGLAERVGLARIRERKYLTDQRPKGSSLDHFRDTLDEVGWCIGLTWSSRAHAVLLGHLLR